VLSQYLLALALAELTVLYLAVADMVVKPSGIDTGVVRYGGGVVALGLLAAAVIAYRGRKRLLGISPWSRPIRTAAEEVRHLHQVERAGESEWTPWIAIAGLILFFVTLGALMFGIVEGAAQLLASAPFRWA
jgi:hypothetical protein